MKQMAGKKVFFSKKRCEQRDAQIVKKKKKKVKKGKKGEKETEGGRGQGRREKVGRERELGKR